MVKRASRFRVAAVCAVIGLIFYSLPCFASVQVKLLSSAEEVAPGSFFTAVFSVANAGEETGTFLLSFDPPPGWGVHGAPDSITLEPGEEEPLFATITVPASAAAGSYEIGFTAVSASDPADTSTAVATVTVSPVNEVEIIPPDGKSGLPGRTIEYEAVIVNRGNVQDSFVIEASSSLGIPVSLSQGGFDLAPQERISIRIDLKIPEDQPPGHDLLTLRVSSSLYAGVEDEASVSTTILPPGPEGIGGTLIETLPARLRVSIGKDLFTGAFSSRLSLSLSGRVLDGFFSGSFSASDPFGPDPLDVGYYSITYRREPASYGIGNVSKRLTDLVSLSCRGGRLEIDGEYYDLILLGGGRDGETRFAGRIAAGPEEANLGISYYDVRTSTSQKAIWSGTAGAEPLAGWTIRLEGALGIDGGLTSRAFLFHTEIDTEGYFLSGETFSIGTFFPGSERDSAGIRLSERLRAGSLSVSLSVSHEWDNVIADPAVPTTITDELGFNLEVSPLEEGPTLTATTNFSWERYSDPTLKSEIDLLLSVGISERDGVFPYAFSGKVSDRIDGVLGTHYRTTTYTQGAGISVDSFYLFLQLTEEALRDVVGGAVLSGSTDVSLTFRPTGTLHEATIGLKNNLDRFDLSASFTVRFTEWLKIVFDGTIGWDGGDASPPSFGFGITFNADLDVPVPFLKTKGRIEGRLFIDTDRDGVYTPADRPVRGAVVKTDGVEVSTDERGLFRFPPLYPGVYEISASGLPSDALPADPLEIELHAGKTVSVDIPLLPGAVVSGVLFEDLDRDGEKDEGEGGFEEVRVILRREDGTVTEAVTDQWGRFEFSTVRPGLCTVSLDRASLPDRFVYTTAAEVTVDASAETPPIQFGGYIRPPQVVLTFQPPTADFTYAPEGPKAGGSVMFDAGSSSDFDGEIVSYSWDFDGDGEEDARGREVSHVFSGAGSYEVSLTVTDNDGDTDTITKTIEVSPAPTGGVTRGSHPPVADFIYAPDRPHANDPVFFDASSSSDPDGEIVSYSWDFDGDGEEDATGKAASYVFIAAGGHEVSLTVTDDDGNTDAITKTIEVSPAPTGGVTRGFQPPIADFSYTPGNPSANDPVLFDASSSSDPDGEIVSYAWDFDGDGSVDSTDVSTEYTFPSSGSYEVSLTVTDNDRNTDTVTYTIEVGDLSSSPPGAFVPPLAEFTYSPEAPHAGEPVEFNGMSSLDFDGSIVSYAWDFEDDGVIDAAGPMVLHAFPTPGSYDVRLTVTDDDGNEDSIVHTIDVD